MHRLVDADTHGEGLVAAAIARAADRRCAEIIEPDRDPQMRVGRGDLVGGIERDPAEALDMRFGPGMTGILLDDAVVAKEIAADIARRDADAARGRDEDVGEVLADTALDREGFLRRGRRLGRIDVEGDLCVNRGEQRMQDGQRIVLR